MKYGALDIIEHHEAQIAELKTKLAQLTREKREAVSTLTEVIGPPRDWNRFSAGTVKRIRTVLAMGNRL